MMPWSLEFPPRALPLRMKMCALELARIAEAPVRSAVRQGCTALLADVPGLIAWGVAS